MYIYIHTRNPSTLMLNCTLGAYKKILDFVEEFLGALKMHDI
jgi:hypothetical protein